ncbi:MAG: large-conductance mechanosensitive channel protein MscL [Prevotella sp.]|jgi:large conductance mechanosensitive channel|nr:large-conductance mechanosensitive channel protein MscL [Prevotella sp.]
MGFIKEFKDFAMRGNVMDMAVGVIIGGAFGKIVSSLVNDLIMPPIGWLIGGINFSELSVKLPVNPLTPEQDPVTINYGAFLQTTLDFLIVAFCIFLLIKGINKLSDLKKKEEEEAAPAAPAGPTQEELLTEIRDLLKNK